MRSAPAEEANVTADACAVERGGARPAPAGTTGGDATADAHSIAGEPAARPAPAGTTGGDAIATGVVGEPTARGPPTPPPEATPLPGVTPLPSSSGPDRSVWPPSQH